MCVLYTAELISYRWGSWVGWRWLRPKEETIALWKNTATHPEHGMISITESSQDLFLWKYIIFVLVLLWTIIWTRFHDVFSSFCNKKAALYNFCCKSCCKMHVLIWQRRMKIRSEARMFSVMSLNTNVNVLHTSLSDCDWSSHSLLIVST